jgi:serine/threonine protein kinase/formylglycine-generating enzyme required for sulfatase activity
MGVVYAAYDPKLDRKVALKLLRPTRTGGDQARGTARLEREAQAIAKLSHPNVVGIFDVLVFEGRVVLAMEYLAGGTLRAWMAAKKRPWREVVAMFIEVGKGLAAAHAAGQIHRDFKPDNVLIDGNGVPKVADFGLARIRSTTGVHQAIASEDEAGAAAGSADSGASDATALTRTGAVAGTPAYMAPEQFVGNEIDARTDQFAFCVALYEALYGERPFAGATVLALAASVADGRVLPAPKGNDTPAWVRACILRGLRPAPEQRHPSMDQVIALLANDPVARRWRRIGLAVGAVAAIVGVVTTRQFALQRREEVRRQVAEQISGADAALTEAGTNGSEARSLGDRAFAAFDAAQRDKGEAIWAERLAASRAADAAYQRGIQHLEAAVTLLPDRGVESRIARALVDYLQSHDRSPYERDEILHRLATYDQGGRYLAALNAAALVTIETRPPGLAVAVESCDPYTHGLAVGARSLGVTPARVSLQPGSYRFIVAETPSHVGFSYPVVVAAAESLTVSLSVPPRSAVPHGFIYVPEGRVMFGSGNEDLRTDFLDTVPIHPRSIGRFLISETEVTVSEWIAFLNTQSDAKGLSVQGREPSGGLVTLTREGEQWRYAFRGWSQEAAAVGGERLRYNGRSEGQDRDWTKFPVTGVTPAAIERFARWKAATGSAPRARLCSELEWERAARGSDSRSFPHGDRLAPADANFDATYGRRPTAFGLDEVKSHLASASPFGVQDMAGNAWELTRSVLGDSHYVARGGCFYQAAKAARVDNRAVVDDQIRTQSIGFRLCADVSESEGTR